MAGHGGKREGAGRKRGSRNSATKEQLATLSELARTYTDDAIGALAKIAKSGKSESARVSAAIAILDRAYGRPLQVQAQDTTVELVGGNTDKDLSDYDIARKIAFLLGKPIHSNDSEESKTAKP